MFAYIFLFLFYSFDWRPSYKEPLPRCQSLNLRFFFLLTQLFSDKFYNKKKEEECGSIGFFFYSTNIQNGRCRLFQAYGKMKSIFRCYRCIQFLFHQNFTPYFLYKGISSSTKSLIISYIDNDTLNISFSYNIISFLYP